MHSRRSFLTRTVAGGIAAAMTGDIGATEDLGTSKRPRLRKESVRIKSAVRRDGTTIRYGGSGDCFHMSWAADDRQLVGVCDGEGWFKQPKGAYNSRLWTITGGPQDASFQDLQGYPDLMIVENTEDIDRYYGLGTLALDGSVYQFLSTCNHRHAQPGARFIGAKLIYSPNKGRTWCNQDGSTPVVWEPRKERSHTNMAFFEESQDAFSFLSILQMGRNYELNRDGYVYVYSPNGNTEGTMNQLVMFRVPETRIRDREAYEYFAGISGEKAQWTKDIEARSVVHTFPRGWVSSPNQGLTDQHPWSWIPSLVYNAPLGLYLMANWGTGNDTAGKWFTKPSYLGFWIAKAPWGPWTQIYEDVAWTPNDDQRARCYMPQISPKWIAEDGKSFWLVWSDHQPMTKEEFERRTEEIKRMSPDEQRRWDLHGNPGYYAFNVQRVDFLMK